MMSSRARLLCALNGDQPDRLPVTTHHLMPSFLKNYLQNASEQEFFDRFGFDAIRWIVAHRADTQAGERLDPGQKTLGFLEARRIVNDQWRIESQSLSNHDLLTTRFRFITPRGELGMTLQANEHTAWVTEHLLKEKTDIDLLGEFMTSPKCDIQAVNVAVDEFGERGIVRGHICCADVFGQPGCWQDAACLVGIEKLIMATFDDPSWVHELLGILQRRKLTFVQSLAGARYDILELGGGDASSTVISPKIFDQFVAPYDMPIIEAAHAVGQRIVYHICGGVMPLLERIVAMGPDAIETFTPKEMGGDADLAKAKERIGDQVCMIGGFDQLHFFQGGSVEQTRLEVRRCFEAAGVGGGFILSPSDHFFDARLELIEAFTEEAKRCVYS